MMGNSYLKTLWFGVKTCSTLAKSNGRVYLSELNTIFKRLHAWARSHGPRPLLRLLSTLRTVLAKRVGECTSHSTGQRLSKISPQKKSVSKLERLSVKKYSSYSIKGELPTVRQRLTDRSWSK